MLEDLRDFNLRKRRIGQRNAQPVIIKLIKYTMKVLSLYYNTYPGEMSEFDQRRLENCQQHCVCIYVISISLNDSLPNAFIGIR